MNYVHGNYGGWSDPENIHYWQNTDIVDSFCTYPVIGIDSDDDLFVTYTNLYGWDEPGSGSYQLYWAWKPAEAYYWIGQYLTKPEGDGYPDALPGKFVYNEVPNYPSVPHKAPYSVDMYNPNSPPIIFGEFSEQTQLHTVYVCRYHEIGIRDIDYKKIPSSEILHQNYPNPFNPNTEISFEIPQQAFIRLNIYDISGKLVKKLIHGKKQAGYHTAYWNGKDQRGNDVPSGAYIYTIKTVNHTQSKTMILMK